MGLSGHDIRYPLRNSLLEDQIRITEGKGERKQGGKKKVIEIDNRNKQKSIQIRQQIEEKKEKKKKKKRTW